MSASPHDADSEQDWGEQGASEQDWVAAELAALGDLEAGPGPEDEAWLSELLPALRDADEAQPGPAPDAIADAVLAEASHARSRTLSWAAGVLLAASLLIAAALAIQSQPDAQRIALQPSPARTQASAPPTSPTPSAALERSPAPTPEASPEPSPSAADPAPEVSPTAPASPAPAVSPEPAASPGTPPGPSPTATSPRVAEPPRERPRPTVSPQPTQVRVVSQAAVVARVKRLSGRSRVRRSGRWVQLAIGDVLRRGEDLQVQRGSLELGLEEGGQAILGSKAKVALEPEWRLDSGVCALTGEGPTLIAGGFRLHGAEESEWVVASHGGARAELEVLSGQVELKGASAARRLGAGQGVDLKRGRAGAARPAGRSPQWLREARLPAGRLLLDEPCLPTSLARYPVLLGEPRGRALEAREKSTADGLAVSLGYGRAVGLCRYAPRARLYLRAWIEREAPLTVQLESPDRAQAWRLTKTPGAGAVTLDLALSALVPVGGKALAAGQALDFLSLQAGVPGQQVALRLEHARIYVPN